MQMTETTPPRISEQIITFCVEIDSNNEPVHVPVRPSVGADFNECFRNVANHITNHSGEIQHGWIIWEMPNLWLNAEFHAVWVSSTGQFIDVTPKVDGESNILFLPDSKRLYKGQLVENWKKLLADNRFTRQWMWGEHNRSLIKEKHFRDGVVNHQSFQAERDQWIDSNDAKRPKIGRNGRCLCGSGKKFKACCIRWWSAV